MKRGVLRNQIFLNLTITVLCIAMFFGLIGYALEIQRRNTLISKIDLYINAVVTNREEVLANELYLKHQASIGLIAKKIAAAKEIIDVSVFDSKGNIFFELNTHQDSKKLDPDYMIYFNNTENNNLKIEQKFQQLRVMTYIYPLTVIDELQGYLQIKYNIADALKESRLNFILFITLIMAMLILLFVVINFVLSRFVIKPLESLMDAMTKVSKGTFGEQVEISHKNEIGEMAGMFNYMSTENARMYSNLDKTNIELDKVRNFLSNIINSMPSILVGVDIDNKVTQWNKAAELSTGISALAAQGQTLADVFPQMASQKEQIAKSIKVREIKQDQKVLRVSEKGMFYEDVTIYPLISNGVEGAVIRVDDVTEKVRLQEMIVQSEKMLTIGGLAAGMAHEINNPLAGMMQTADVIANRLSDKVNIPANIKAAKNAGTTMKSIQIFMEARDIPRMLTTINNSGRRMAEIVNNMLSFARKQDSATSSHNPVDLMDSILELASTDYDLKKQYDFKTIKIQKQYEDNLPVIPCDKGKIQQVLLNILKNGAQAMQENMEKDSTNKPEFILRLSLESKINMLRIEIEDNGHGMDKAIRKRIFEPFFTTKPVGIGTGLGLSVAYFIITEHHDGEMKVETAPGLGAKFIIRLPLEGKTR